jgi:GT2 family glycosyltransferase
MLHLAVPVIDQHNLTLQLLDSLDQTVLDTDAFSVLLVDNGSAEPYTCLDLRTHQRPYAVDLIRNPTNIGYYRPLLQLATRATEADLVALAHNDLILYETGWDRRLRDHFVADGRLGMVGFCGSAELDRNGGRGGDTKCHFRGESGQPQAAGRRITGLEPAIVLDSLFMAMRRPVVDALGVDIHTPLCHFVDKLWCLRAIEAGWRVGVLGVEVDHLGGQTAIGVESYREDARRWCLSEGFDPGDDPGLAIYKEAERRFLAEAARLRRLDTRAQW